MSKDPSFPSTSSSASQEAHENRSGQAASRKLKVTLLSSEWQSTKGGLSTVNRELAIQFAKHPNVEVSMYLPQCSEEDVKIAEGYHVKLIQARKLVGYEPIEWLSYAPENHKIDYVIGHGLILGRQVQLIQRCLKCKWIQVVHTAPEDLGMFKKYANAISKAEEKHKAEIELCELADEVVAVGPKLADEYSRYLRHCQRDQSVFEVTPSIFSEFSVVKQAAEERRTFCVLVFGRGDTEDFELKGYDIAAKAISELNDASYELIFVGAPPGKEEEVAVKLCQHGIARRQLTVRSFKESREYLGRLFCEVDLCIMPSRTEGFGLVALEALSAGLPILVSGNSGLGYALQDVPLGSSCVVNSEDPKEWAKAIENVRKKSRNLRLLETEILRTQYAKKYCWKEQCDELVKIMFNNIFGTHAVEGGQDLSLTSIHLPSIVVSESYVESTRAGINLTEKQGKRPSHPSDTPSSKKRRHDTDICREIHHASLEEEASSMTSSHLATTCTVDTQARNVYEAATADSDVVILLRKEYKRRAEFRPLLWNTGKGMKLHLDEVYTRLKIVVRPKGLGESEIDLGDIFCCNKGEDSMVLAEGSPGIGKTTLCLKLAYDWANQSMPSTFPVFELVLLLKCRDLDGDIMEAIFEQLLPEDMEETSKKRLMNFITDIHSQERILMILDGLDELPEGSKHHLDKLLERRVLPFCYVLATTRQEKGIEARKQFAFDICLQIEGFSEEDSFEYIRKHFKNIDPSKGESLIEETEENTILHALQNNPLNLLLLCVVYEDHEGKLPSSRTNLYQIIVRCLLRRYCEKNSVKASKKDRNLEKQFEADLLVLGELAWKCLLSDRHSFREGELKKFERSDDKLVVRNLGLVYKEESLKRLKPRHEYFFLHKSFQEYLAASYIAHKLRRNQFNVFEHVDYDEVVKKFRQVFLFVCGILREEARILFTQIGEKMKSNWDWLTCDREKAIFFVESFSESGNPERMADALFSFIPFPRVVHLSLFTDDSDEEFDSPGHWNVVEVLRACTGFSKVHIPEVHIQIPLDVFFRNLLQLQSLPNVKNLNIADNIDEEEYLVANVFEEIPNFTSLSELTLPPLVDCSEWEIVAKYLKTSETLEKLTFTLLNEFSDGWARALTCGLCADTPLSSVGLSIHGSLSRTASQALENLLFNKSLSSLSIHICRDMQDSLAAALARGLAGPIAVKVVVVCVDGKLSLRGANLIEQGIVGNNSRSELIIYLRGEVPDNWQTVGKNLHSRFGQKASALFTIYPNTISKLTASRVTPFCPFGRKDGLLVKQNVTLNIWGQLDGDGAEALDENVLYSSLSHLTLDIHGKLTKDILNSAARWVDGRNALSSLTINTWEELTKEGKTLFEELKLDKNPAVTLNVRDVPAPPEELRDDEFVSIDDLESLIVLFKEAKNTGKQNLSATINSKNDILPIKETLNNSDLGNGVDAGAASNTSLVALAREDIKYAANFLDREGEDDLVHVLASNTTLNYLSLTFYGDSNKSSFGTLLGNSWALLLGDGLARNSSLITLSLTFNNNSENGCVWLPYLVDGLHRNTSVKNLTLAIHYHMGMGDTWRESLGNSLERNSSLKNVTLVIETHSEVKLDDLSIIWARNTSVENLFLTVNNHFVLNDPWVDNLGSGLTGNESALKNLALTINNFGNLRLDWEVDEELENKSLNDFSLTINNYGYIYDDDDSYFTGFLSQFKSLTTFNLTLNLWGNGGEGILYGLLEEAMISESLETLRLNVNDPQITNDSCAYDFSEFVVRSPSLSLIEVTVSFYGVEESSRELNLEGESGRIGKRQVLNY